jgi:peroxiredoxin
MMPPSDLLSTPDEMRVDLLQLASVSNIVLCLYPALLSPSELRATAWSTRAHEAVAMDFLLVAVSTETVEQQAKALQSLDASFTCLSDPDMALATALPLTTTRTPTNAYAPATLVIRDRHVVKVLRDVGIEDAAIVIDWLRANT